MEVVLPNQNLRRNLIPQISRKQRFELPRIRRSLRKRLFCQIPALPLILPRNLAKSRDFLRLSELRCELYLRRDPLPHIHSKCLPPTNRLPGQILRNRRFNHILEISHEILRVLRLWEGCVGEDRGILSLLKLLSLELLSHSLLDLLLEKLLRLLEKKSVLRCLPGFSGLGLSLSRSGTFSPLFESWVVTALLGCALTSSRFLRLVFDVFTRRRRLKILRRKSRL